MCAGAVRQAAAISQSSHFLAVHVQKPFGKVISGGNGCLAFLPTPLFAGSGQAQTDVLLWRGLHRQAEVAALTLALYGVVAMARVALAGSDASGWLKMAFELSRDL